MLPAEGLSDMPLLHRFLLCVGVLFSTSGLKSEEESSPEVALRCSQCPCGRCQMAETRHFRIHFCAPAERVTELARDCEESLKLFREQWYEGETAEWSPRCDVVVHPTVAAYRQYLGPGSERTSGCSTISLGRAGTPLAGKVVQRRIDLRADAEGWVTESLPHEITHVALADRFSQNRIPSWADEGIAMLAESPEKLQRRLEETRGHWRSGTQLGPRELVGIKNSPPPSKWGVYYGESLLLTGFLLERGSPADFLQFVEKGERQGYLAALRVVYGIDSWSALEEPWREYVRTNRVRTLSGHNFREVTLLKRASSRVPNHDLAQD